MLRCCSTSPLDELLSELRQVTAKLGDDAVMQISDLQGKWLTQLVQISGTRRALEIGTFTGHSSLCIAAGLPQDGRLTCLDASDEWTGIANSFWERAGLADKISLKIGPALETVASLDGPFDFVFIDADKTEYDGYFEATLPLVRTGGILAFDNMLRDGRVLNAEQDPSTAAIHQLNLKLANDPRIESVFLPIADGIQLLRKL